MTLASAAASPAADTSATPAVCDFRDMLRLGGTSQAMVRKVVTTLGSLIAHAKERGKFSGANPVRDITRGKRGGRAEKRQKGRLEIGRDIPYQG
jgi:integrase